MAVAQVRRTTPVEALVLGFDVEADVSMQQPRTLGQLEMAGAFELPDRVMGTPDEASMRALARYVGASWCRIVHDDVRYRILHGLETVEESGPFARKLVDWVLRPEHASRGCPEDSEFLAYAAARWCDGAAKIRFRLGDYARARIGFEEAVKIAEHAGLRRCLPDLRSNLVRAAYDENDQAGGAAQLQRDYEIALEQLLREDGLSVGRSPKNPEKETVDEILEEALLELRATLEARAPEIRAFVKGEGPRPALEAVKAPPRVAGDRERWRGYCSLFHNLSIAARASKDVEGSRAHSWRAAAIAWAMSDAYRLAQALNHQCGFHEKVDDPVAEGLAMAVLALGWRRGARIAEQALARIEGRRGELDAAVRRLGALFEELALDRERRGGDLGIDVMSHRYTVNALKTVLDTNKALAKEARYEAARRTLAHEEAEMIRAIRRLVAVATYKSAYAKHVFPYFLTRIEAHVKGEGHEWMESISLVEESSCRELLDVIREAARPKSFGKHHRKAPVPVPPDYRVLSDNGRRSGVRGEKPDDEAEITKQMRSQKEAFERRALASPLEPAPHNDEIGFDLRRFTAVHKGVTIVRYFYHGARLEGDKPVPAGLGAYVFRDGKVPAFAQLALDEARELMAEIDGEAARPDNQENYRWGLPPPGYGMAKRLWSVLFRPLWPHVTDSAPKEGEPPREPRLPSHLIVIPAGDLFRLPLHVAMVPGAGSTPSRPLCTVVPLSFSTSATTLVTRGRYLLVEQPIDPSDDLCFLAPREDDLCPEEMLRIRWPQEHFHVAGAVPKDLDISQIRYLGKGDQEGLDCLIAEEPEIFVFSGHGLMQQDDLALKLESGVLTHYEIPARMRLPRNKLTLLAACVTGQGAQMGGGEVSGFLRAFMAAGAGVLGVSLWSVSTSRMADTIRALLAEARPPEEPEEGEARTFNAVAALHRYYVATLAKLEAEDVGPNERMDAFPLILYL